MFAPSRTVRLFSAAMATFVSATLLMAKVHFSDELTRLTAKHDVVVLPVVEVVAERSAHLAAMPSVQRAN
jgi:hypothetical protein